MLTRGLSTPAGCCPPHPDLDVYQNTLPRNVFRLPKHRPQRPDRHESPSVPDPAPHPGQ
jgi:hypothetical protein